MDLYYQSTRDSSLRVTASQAVLQGLAPDGGLFVPGKIPELGVELPRLASMTYQETALAVMKQFLTDYTEEELKDCIRKAYDDKFDTEAVAPLAKAGGLYYLELFHGPTIAFKDMALSILPHLMTRAAEKNHLDKEIVILTATSGDTGKAAMAGFADVPGTRIIVFYPRDGVSQVQKLQMVTQKGANVDVVAVTGNFDDAQSGVKALFRDKDLAAEMAAAGRQFSSANSINIGRLVPQIVYYVYAYGRLLENEKIQAGDKITAVNGEPVGGLSLLQTGRCRHFPQVHSGNAAARSSPDRPGRFPRCRRRRSNPAGRRQTAGSSSGISPVCNMPWNYRRCM